MEGILLIDKPEGMSSFAVVAAVRRKLSQQQGHKVKVGHTGTLDPMATGLLILVIGKYTKMASGFSKLDKTYEAELTLGSISTTADKEGVITKKSVHRPAEAHVEQTLSKFIGEQYQTPPAFSAIKVGGQRAYKLARAGREVAIEPRKITVKSIRNVHYDYPLLSFTTEVSSGTYIRSLATDIGERLGTGAYLSELRRTAIGNYSIEQARTIEEFDADDIRGLPLSDGP